MPEDARNAGVFHLGQRAPQHCVHEEDVRYAVGLQELREKARSVHFFRHEFLPVKRNSKAIHRQGRKGRQGRPEQGKYFLEFCF
jgi:hypothetical protein